MKRVLGLLLLSCCVRPSVCYAEYYYWCQGISQSPNELNNVYIVSQVYYDDNSNPSDLYYANALCNQKLFDVIKHDYPQYFSGINWHANTSVDKITADRSRSLFLANQRVYSLSTRVVELP